MNIGFDLDGVIAARPLIFKLNHTKGRYRINLSVWEQWFWRLVLGIRSPSHFSRIHLNSPNSITSKLYLITGRLSFLEDLTLWWLKKYNLDQYFTKIIVNVKNQQPHEFKAEKIKEFKITQFYEDELFTADYLKNHSHARIILVVANGKSVHEI